MHSALVVCHGELGAAFQNAIACIFGDLDGFGVVGNAGLSAEALQGEVERSLDVLGDGGLVFTDYFGGSCATACQAALRSRPHFRLVSGVNLPMLIFFFTHRSEMSLEAILTGVIHRGQNAIRELTPPGL